MRSKKRPLGVLTPHWISDFRMALGDLDQQAFEADVVLLHFLVERCAIDAE